MKTFHLMRQNWIRFPEKQEKQKFLFPIKQSFRLIFSGVSDSKCPDLCFKRIILASQAALETHRLFFWVEWAEPAEQVERGAGLTWLQR